MAGWLVPAVREVPPAATVHRDAWAMPEVERACLKSLADALPFG